MKSETGSTELLGLLNQALARELQVCVQYMLQHGIGAGQVLAGAADGGSATQVKFVASHSSVWLPGATLKKVAITEMRHAEAIAERVTLLGGAPTTQPDTITIGQGVKAMLAIDRKEEESAIALYPQIIELAAAQGDKVTGALFQRILADEQKHLQAFVGMLARG